MWTGLKLGKDNNNLLYMIKKKIAIQYSQKRPMYSGSLKKN